MGRRGRRPKQLLVDVREKIGYWRKYQTVLCGELALKEAMDFSLDYKINGWDVFSAQFEANQTYRIGLRLYSDTVKTDNLESVFTRLHQVQQQFRAVRVN